MQPGQVAPNQNFLNRPPGPIPVSHGNVQQQVTDLTELACLPVTPSLTLPGVDTLTALVPADLCMPDC